MYIAPRSRNLPLVAEFQRVIFGDVPAGQRRHLRPGGGVYSLSVGGGETKGKVLVRSVGWNRVDDREGAGERVVGENVQVGRVERSRDDVVGARADAVRRGGGG